MANFTCNAIKDSFLRLLNERPLSKITVKDIVEDCGINRNSFYYHYQDIPALMEEIITEEADRIIRAYPSISSIEECLNVAIEFALANRQAVLHIYHSIQRDAYEQYLWRVCEHVAGAYLNTAFPDAPLRETDRAILTRYYKSLCFGIITDWLNAGMKEDVRGDFTRLCRLKHGMAEELIRRSIEE